MISSSGALFRSISVTFGAVERLVIADVDAEPFAADHGARAERFGGVGILHHFADARAQEIGGGLVGALVDQQIVERAGVAKPAAIPALAKGALALLVADRQRRHVGGRAEEAVAPGLGERAQRRIFGLDRSLFARIERRVARRHDEARRALEHIEVRGLRGDERDRLHGGRAGADDADALPGEVDALVRPGAGVIGRAGERLGALELRLVRHREAAGRHHAIGCA